MIQMTRSILPVGQGAFYLEQFHLDSGKINVVYDCGSSTNVEFVKKQIDDNFALGEEVQAVFISHFDVDHINGIEYLLEHCHVRHIFFPFVTRKNISILLLNYFCKSGNATSNSFEYRFIEDPSRAVSSIRQENQTSTNDNFVTVLHPVLPSHGDEEYLQDQQDARHWSDDDLVQSIRSGDSVLRHIDTMSSALSGKIDWQYIPFNFKREERYKQFMDALCFEFKGPCDPEKLVKRCIDDPSLIKKVRSAFNKVSGTHNSNSLVLFSGCISPLPSRQEILLDRLEKNSSCPCYTESAPSGCLYTGDYEAAGVQKWHELERALSDKFDYIECVQLPHHGSRHNFNTEFLNFLNCKYYFASAGYRNKYKLPSISVLLEIFYSGKYPIIVTEQSKHGLRFSIDLN